MARYFVFLTLPWLGIVGLVIVWAVYRYGGNVWAFFKRITRPPDKLPEIHCPRCQSARVIFHEQIEGGLFRRLFWCNQCGHEWFKVEYYRGTGSEERGLKS